MSNILVIEDDPYVRDIIADLLSAEGYQVMSARNGRLGIEQALAQTPDLILCDIMMPEVDGYEVLRTLRARPETSLTPFIFLTALSERSAIRQGMTLGADDYLTKPFSSVELLEAVRSRLRRQAQLQTRYEEKLESLRNSLSRMLPHELRTPLTIILGFTELLIEEWESIEPTQAKNTLMSIQEAGRRLEQLAEKYILYMRLEIVASDPDKRAALRTARTRQTTELIQEAAREKATQFNRTGDLFLSLTDSSVYIAEPYLRKVVDELLDNAFKFSHSATPVQVSSSEENDRFILTVKDRGRGMTQEQLDQVDAFIQFERERQEQQGTGLGLAIARQLADLHGGTLTIESQPGAGTTVQLSLPMQGEAVLSR
jgi:two-component system sensor histidine kinase/response regulator